MWRLCLAFPTSSTVKGKSVAGFLSSSIFLFIPPHVLRPLTHSFIHSFGSFWPLREPLQFRFWLLVYGLNFISFHFQTSNPNSYPHAPTSPERSCVWKFWVIYQIFKVTFGIVTLVFFLCSVEIEKAFQWRYAFASQPFLKNVAYPWRCGQIALRAAFDKSET